jgi:hypothetical protein
MDEEDLISAAELSNKIADTMITAFQERFPKIDCRAVYVITGSCAATVMSMIMAIIEEGTRELIYHDFIDLLQDLYKESNRLADL